MKTFTVHRIRVMLCIGLLAASTAQAACLSGRYVTRGDEVIDRQSGLAWSRCAIGQTGASCNGKPTLYSFAESIQFAKTRPGWRVPSRDELMTLVQPACHAPSINSRFFPNVMDMSVWSTTPSADNNGSGGWVVNLLEGYDEIVNRTNAKALRLVRSVF